MDKVDFFQKLGLALGLGLGLGLAYQFLKMATFDGPDGVQGWESDEKRIFGQRFWPESVEKLTTGGRAGYSGPLCDKITVMITRCEKKRAVDRYTAVDRYRERALTGYFII